MADPKPKRPPKTIKEKRFVKEYLKSGNGTQAVLKVYNTTNENSANVIASENLRKLTIVEIMDANGLADRNLIDYLYEGLNKAIRIHGTDDNFVELPDYGVRHKYLETALKIKDKFPSDRLQIDGNITVSFDMYANNIDARAVQLPGQADASMVNPTQP